MAMQTKPIMGVSLEKVIDQFKKKAEHQRIAFFRVSEKDQ